MVRPEFIGIVGASGSGKSTLCKELKKSSRDFEHIKLDNYFRDPKTFPKKFGFPNWERPANLKFDILLKHLKALRRGKTIHTKSFPKKAGGISKPIIIRPKKYILVEGFILFMNKAVRGFLDKKIYLDIPSKLMLKRRARRFGDAHITDYDTKVAIPEYLKYGIKQKKFADYIINAARPQSAVIKVVRKIIEK
ncbi:MAG: AAA family ATPase [Candidatus Doudnabacteria bacterium]|nr:AAA family ATPase [Candidatus Doudnabacteria bacterium]